jgi:hypothetical protein
MSRESWRSVAGRDEGDVMRGGRVGHTSGLDVGGGVDDARRSLCHRRRRAGSSV